MGALALTLAAAAPLLLAGADEKGTFHMPAVGDFRFQAIARSDAEEGWPFAAGEGYLTCAYAMGGQRLTYFMEKGEAAEGLSRALSISTDPFQLGFANWGQGSRFAPHDGLEDLIRRVAPFVEAAQRLCDQPRGTAIGPGEL